jgi:hypothetical protein
MDEMHDSDLVDGTDVDAVYSRSSRKWASAIARLQFPIHDSCVDLRQCLHRIPSLPKKIPSDVHYIEGKSSWDNLDQHCKNKTKAERTKKLHLVKRYASKVTIHWAAGHFPTWRGDACNGIALLTLAWAYVLSAALAERKGLSMLYGAKSLSCRTATVLPTTLNLDYAIPKERRWWKAIIADGIGWSIASKDISPWAVEVEELGIEIDEDVESHHLPPTAREAACYISRLCYAYDLSNQASAALAASLCIPLRSSLRFSSPDNIQLPKPKLGKLKQTQPGSLGPPADFKLLDYLMTLSLCHWAIGSALWSVFWAPDIPCTLAGAWLVPIYDSLRPLTNMHATESLAKALSFTAAAPLWIGLAICGFEGVISRIPLFLTELHDFPFTSPDMDAAAWTGIPTSFFDKRRTSPCRDGVVLREDVWRLRHDFAARYVDDVFSVDPRSGWAPFGKMRVIDVELEIQDHLQCSHKWEYRYWTWSLCGATDHGYSAVANNRQLSERTSQDSPALLEPSHISAAYRLLIRKISEKATRKIFAWAGSEVEKGFGNTIVPRHSYGHDIPLEEKRGDSIEPPSINDWLKAVEEAQRKD